MGGVSLVAAQVTGLEEDEAKDTVLCALFPVPVAKRPCVETLPYGSPTQLPQGRPHIPVYMLLNACMIRFHLVP